MEGSANDTGTTTPIAHLQKEILRMQNESASRARLTQSLILAMTLVAFLIGVCLVILSIFQFVYFGNSIFGSILSVSGLSSILAVLFYKPMQKAQVSVNNLVQIQIAFLSFNSKVTLWTEYVIARSRSNGAGLDIERVKEATADIETAASKALAEIEKFCSEKKDRDSTTINE